MASELKRGGTDCGCSRRSVLLGALGAVVLPVPAVAAVPGQGVRHVAGTVRADGRRLGDRDVVAPGTTVETGPDGEVAFVYGHHAFLLRSGTTVHLLGQARQRVLTGFRLLTGAVLSVFAPGPKRILTPTVTMGIRGTGVYLRVDGAQTYACTCYGRVRIAAVHGPGVLDVAASHHSASRVTDRGDGTTDFAPAGMEDHSDAELAMLEGFVGRRPPFMA
ncbi:MAG: hypothetical protein GC151_00315 [Betaproteobacteria bacterium]|nr:hypothetical protein [Betaproteobacteria bacterium]